MTTPNSTVEAVELLPCPFCGCAIHLDYDTQHGYFGPEGTHARGCFIGTIDFRDYADEHHAIAAWNTRAAMPAVSEGEARLTPEYLAMTPLQKWDTLALHGLLGTNEPWIADMRRTLSNLPTPTDHKKIIGELLEEVANGGPHEWGYRCAASGEFIADDWPFRILAALTHARQIGGA